MLDSGNKVKKNQKIPNEINLYLSDIRIAIIKILIKIKKLARVGKCIKVFEIA